MQALRRWLRKWLGIADLHDWALKQESAWETARKLEKEQRDAAIAGALENPKRMIENLMRENADLTRELDELKGLNIQKRLIDLETRNEKPIDKPPESNPAGSWSSMVHKIEQGNGLG